MAALLKPLARLERFFRKARTRTAKRNERQVTAQKKRLSWHLLRVQIHQRDGGKCRRCHKKVYLSTPNLDALLEVHHVIFRSAGGSDHPSNLVALCLPCHSLIHTHRAEWKGMIQ